MTPRKEELVDAVIVYLVEHGLADLSLRPLAAATGTSARMLVFHFGSKEGLITAVLDTMQARLQESVAKLVARTSATRTHVAPIKTIWNWAIAEKNFGYLRVLYELQTLALHDSSSYAVFLKRNSVRWIDLVKEFLPPSRRTSSLATLLCAVFDGLFLELLSTGDRRRTTLALDQFVRIARKGM